MSAAEYTTEQILAAIRAAIVAHDMPAVVSLMRMLAVRDPDAAQTLLDMITLMRSSSTTEGTT